MSAVSSEPWTCLFAGRAVSFWSHGTAAWVACFSATHLSVALEQGRVAVTLDKDFGDLAVARGRSHAGIIRLVGLPARRQAEY